RLAMNLESIVKSTYFRSYWVQRNASQMKQFRAEVADVNRTDAALTESRVLVRGAETAGNGPEPEARAALARLVTLAPEAASFYRGYAAPDTTVAATAVVDKL